MCAQTAVTDRLNGWDTVQSAEATTPLKKKLKYMKKNLNFYNLINQVVEK